MALKFAILDQHTGKAPKITHGLQLLKIPGAGGKVSGLQALSEVCVDRTFVSTMDADHNVLHTLGLDLAVEA